MVLPHGDDAATVLVDEHVGVADVGRGRDRAWCGVAVLAVEALVTVVGEEQRPVLDRVVAAPVLVNAAARVVALGDEVFDAAVGVAPADHDAAALVSPLL